VFWKRRGQDGPRRCEKGQGDEQKDKPAAAKGQTGVQGHAQITVVG